MLCPCQHDPGDADRGVREPVPAAGCRVSLRPDSGGAGMFRGGLGVRRVFEVTAPSVTLSALLDRVKQGSWGLFGGEAGSPAGVFVRHKGEATFRTFVEAYGTVSPTKFINIELKRATSCCCIRPAAAATATRNSAATAPCRTICVIVSLRWRVWRRMGGHRLRRGSVPVRLKAPRGLRPGSGISAQLASEVDLPSVRPRHGSRNRRVPVPCR